MGKDKKDKREKNENTAELAEKEIEVKEADFESPSEKTSQDIIDVNITGQTKEELEKEFEEFKIKKILHRIDHTLLKQDITRDDLRKLVSEAKQYGFYSVCVQPVHAAFVKSLLGKDSNVKLCVVVSFPFGEDNSKVKAYQAKRAIMDGADEIDMVMCISAFKEKNYRYVKKDIETVVKAVKKAPVKVIIETSMLSVKEIDFACSCVKSARAKFVKTSTGYFGEGANPQLIKLIRSYVGNDFSIKASGGIKNYDDAIALLNAGADRIGTSNGVAIAEGLIGKGIY